MTHTEIGATTPTNFYFDDDDCTPSTAEINAALRAWLCEPLTDEQRSVIAASVHFSREVLGEAAYEAWAIERRNRALPCNFTESLDSCRMVRERLPDSLRLRFAALLMKRAGGGWESLAFASAYDHAAALCDVLDLAVGL